MAKNTVSLTVHKNTKERRRRKELRRDMVSAARSMGSRPDIRGYVLIGIAENGKAYGSWDTGQAIPTWAMPGFVTEAVRAETNNWFTESEGEDDYDPRQNK